MNGTPVLSVTGRNLPEAWEKSLIKLWESGMNIKTQYDKPDDPLSIDATMIITVEDPLSEPLIHRDMVGGLNDLQEYSMEVLDGIKDHLIRDTEDEDDHKWEYTYHQRLFAYPYGEKTNGYTQHYRSLSLNQIDKMIDKLVDSPYTRRAQAVTWDVKHDNECYDPPCLQSLWCRITEEGDGCDYLSMNVRMRSNDAYRAAFMNMYAFIRLQEYILNEVNRKRAEIGSKSEDTKYSLVKMGRYCHMADSYHLYGSTIDQFNMRFFKNYVEREFEDRTYNYEDVKDIMGEAIPAIEEKVRNL